MNNFGGKMVFITLLVMVVVGVLLRLAGLGWLGIFLSGIAVVVVLGFLIVGPALIFYRFSVNWGGVVVWGIISWLITLMIPKDWSGRSCLGLIYEVLTHPAAFIFWWHLIFSFLYNLHTLQYSIYSCILTLCSIVR